MEQNAKLTSNPKYLLDNTKLKGICMDNKMNKRGIWIFRLLVLLAIALVAYAFAQPWWICDLGSGATVKIYGWGLRQNLQALAEYIMKDITPHWQTILAWVYVGASSLLAFFSTWIRGLAGILLLGLIGIGFTIYPIISIYVVISNRIANFDIVLQGTSITQGEILVTSDITSWHYLMIAGGILLIILTLIRSTLMYHAEHLKT